MSLLALLDSSFIAQRAWLDRLALVVPSERTTRWLLLLDAACLIVIGLDRRHRARGVVGALGGGFIVLNALGLALTDFFLALATFHWLVAATAAVSLGRVRWLGVLATVLVLAAGMLT